MYMPAYIVFIREKTLDQSELRAYWSKAGATLEGHPVKALAAYGRHVTLEGPEVQGIALSSSRRSKRPAPCITARPIARWPSFGSAAPCTEA